MKMTLEAIKDVLISFFPARQLGDSYTIQHAAAEILKMHEAAIDTAWLPISSAPKDETLVALLCPNGPDYGRYYNYSHREDAQLAGEWSTMLGNGEPTHWKPLDERKNHE